LLIVVVRIVIRGDFSLGEAFGEAKLIEFEWKCVFLQWNLDILGIKVSVAVVFSVQVKNRSN
jgi:hypothetical protein